MSSRKYVRWIDSKFTTRVGEAVEAFEDIASPIKANTPQAVARLLFSLVEGAPELDAGKASKCSPHWNGPAVKHVQPGMFSLVAITARQDLSAQQSEGDAKQEAPLENSFEDEIKDPWQFKMRGSHIIPHMSQI